MICVSVYKTHISSSTSYNTNRNTYKLIQIQTNTIHNTNRPTCGRGRNNNWVYAHWYEEGSFSGKSQCFFFVLCS